MTFAERSIVQIYVQTAGFPAYRTSLDWELTPFYFGLQLSQTAFQQLAASCQNRIPNHRK